MFMQTFTKCLNVPVTVEALEVQRRVRYGVAMKNKQSGGKDSQ